MGVKISELQETSISQDSDMFPLVQNGETKKISKETFLESTNEKIENSIDEIGNASWTSISSDYGTLYYKKLSDNMYFLRGSFAGFTEIFRITLPFTTTYQHVFFMAGSGTYYTKSAINANTNEILFTVGTGTNTGINPTQYVLNHLVIIN